MDQRIRSCLAAGGGGVVRGSGELAACLLDPPPRAARHRQPRGHKLCSNSVAEVEVNHRQGRHLASRASENYRR